MRVTHCEVCGNPIKKRKGNHINNRVTCSVECKDYMRKNSSRLYTKLISFEFDEVTNYCKENNISKRGLVRNMLIEKGVITKRKDVKR